MLEIDKPGLHNTIGERERVDVYSSQIGVAQIPGNLSSALYSRGYRFLSERPSLLSCYWFDQYTQRHIPLANLSYLEKGNGNPV